MKAQDRRAIEASIAHWIRMRDDKGTPDEEPNAVCCPLCKLYFDKSCIGCPIFTKTGADLCRGTPYEAAHAAWESHYCTSPKTEERHKLWRTTANAMIRFLRSLLPRKAKP